ncbi:MAG: GSCFA domain-containing protein [Bacteroidota bacterium]|nr:GSCFA domain-containing protein [Bacteroidota bacterium]
MKFKLEFDIAPFASKINPDGKLFFAGSCFSENIASLFEKYKFDIVSNTHGILYNPHSIARSIFDCVEKRTYTEQDLFYANESWNSFNHHGRFSNSDKKNCLDEINKQISKAHELLKKCKHLFITFGSAFIYKHIESGLFVGNCHKIPQKQFQKIILSKEEVIDQYKKLVKNLKEINPGINIVFTASPVRYIRDGVAENNLSKAILLQAVHELVAAHEHCFYFPSYEIVNDELRDYRFFEADMVHPNQLAIDYVWERLSEVCFGSGTKELISELDLILNAASHKPFNESSEAHKKFKETYFKKCDELKRKFAHLDFGKEQKIFTI